MTREFSWALKSLTLHFLGHTLKNCQVITGSCFSFNNETFT